MRTPRDRNHADSPGRTETVFVADQTLSTFSYISRPIEEVLSRPLTGPAQLPQLWGDRVREVDRVETAAAIYRAIHERVQTRIRYRLASIDTSSEESDLWIELRLYPLDDLGGCAAPDDMRTLASRGLKLGEARWVGILSDYTEARRRVVALTRAQEKDVLLGAGIQQALLLGEPIRNNPYATFAIETLPSQDLDGDFYDFFRYSDSVLDFIIGDVMGKGISAALVGSAVKMAFARAAVDQLIHEPAPPSLPALVAEAERRVARELLRIRRFVTMYACRLDMEASALDYLDCGHTYIVHVSGRDGTPWILKGANMPIGFVETQVFRTHRLPLEEGDMLFFYSDGLTEARNSEGQFFGEERIMHYLSAHHEGTPQAILSALFALVFAFSVDDVHDDITGVMIRIDHPAKPYEPVERRRFAIGTGLPTEARRFLQDCITQLPISADSVTQILYAVHEALVNVLVHDTEAGRNEGDTIEVSFDNRGDWVYIALSYRGSPFVVSRPDSPEEILAERIGRFAQHGYGVPLMHAVMDSIVLETGLHGAVRLVMAKRLSFDTGMPPEAGDSSKDGTAPTAGGAPQE